MCSQFCFFISIVELPSSIALFSFSAYEAEEKIDRETLVKDFCIRVDFFSALATNSLPKAIVSTCPPPPSSFHHPLPFYLCRSSQSFSHLLIRFPRHLLPPAISPGWAKETNGTGFNQVGCREISRSVELNRLTFVRCYSLHCNPSTEKR